MAILFSISEQGITGVSTEFANIVLRVGCCTDGVANTVYEFDPGQDSQPTLGYGPLAVADARAAKHAQNAQRYACKVVATTAGEISAVTQTGSGPLPTVAGSDFDSLNGSPFGAYTAKVRVAVGGAPGTARVEVALDGAAYDYTFDIPAQAPPTLIGTVDVSGFTWGVGGNVGTRTLTIGAATCTFASPASATAMLAALEGAISGYGFDLVQGKYLRIRKDTSGSGASFAVDAASTADSVFGLVNDTVNGSDSLVTIPGTGLEITFPTGTYVKGEIYSFTTTAPRCSLANITTALTTAGQDHSIDFGLACVVQPPLDEVDARAYANALDGLAEAWEAQSDKRFVVWVANTPLDTADADVKLAMATHTSRHGAMAHRDCWLTSSSPQPLGSFRAPLVEALAIRCADQPSFSEDPGFGGYGPLPCDLASPDGATKARNEATASIKMGTSKGPGFTTLESKGGKPYFTRGITRAGANSRFVDLGVVRAEKAAAAVLFQALRRFENPTFDLNPDGTMQEADAAALETAFVEELTEFFVRRKHFSAAVVQIDRAEDISSTRNFTVAWTLQTRGQGENATGKLTIAGTLTIT